MSDVTERTTKIERNPIHHDNRQANTAMTFLSYIVIHWHYYEERMQHIFEKILLPVGLDIRKLLFCTTIVLLWASSFGFSSRNRQHRPIPNSSQNDNSGEKTVVIAYHKPPNVITSHFDEEALMSTKSGPRTTVYDDIQSPQGWVGRTTTTVQTKTSWKEITGIQSKLHAIGRLDCDTTGLLLLTNDGGLVHHVTNPAAKTLAVKAVTKTYEALIMGHHSDDCPEFQAMRTVGVDIGAKYGGMTQPAIHLTVLDHPTAKTTLVSITIAEGRNRQVRRMFHSIGSGVMQLKRTNIGEHLNLEGLELGQWRVLSDEEVSRALDWRVRTLGDPNQVKTFRSKRGGNGDAKGPANHRQAKPKARRRKH